MKKKNIVIEIGNFKISLPPIAMLILIIIAVILIASALLIPQVKDFLGIGKWPTSFSDMKPDEVMGYTETEVIQAVLGETEDKTELIILEQEVSVELEITKALANIPLFEKSKRIVSHGKGGFSVDLSLVTEDTIFFDHDLKTIEIVIPHAKLLFAEPDFERTEFYDTQKALLAFGDIKLTQEQQNVINLQIAEKMKEELSKSNRLAYADLRAVQQVKAFLKPIVEGVAPEYTLKVVQ